MTRKFDIHRIKMCVCAIETRNVNVDILVIVYFLKHPLYLFLISAEWI